MEMKDAIEQIKGLNSKIDRIPDYGGDIKSLKDAVEAIQIAQKKYEFGAAATGARQPMDDTKALAAYLSGKSATFESKTVGTVLNPVSGGYLAIPWFSDRVIKKLFDTSPMMDVAEVFQVDGNIAELPVEVDEVAGKWVGEVETRPDATWKVGMANIPINEYVAKAPVSQVLLEDSNLVGIEDYLTNSATGSIGRAIGKAFVQGDGNKKPVGIFSSPDLSTNTSKTTATIETDDLLDAMGSVPSEALYNAKWLMSTKTFYEIVKEFKNQSGVVQMPLADGFGPMIYGKEVHFMDAPDGTVSNNIGVVFGDIFNAYKICIRRSLEMQRDPYSGADDGQVILRYRTRVGGGLVQPGSVIGIKTK